MIMSQGIGSWAYPENCKLSGKKYGFWFNIQQFSDRFKLVIEKVFVILLQYLMVESIDCIFAERYEYIFDSCVFMFSNDGDYFKNSRKN